MYIQACKYVHWSMINNCVHMYTNIRNCMYVHTLHTHICLDICTIFIWLHHCAKSVVLGYLHCICQTEMDICKKYFYVHALMYIHTYIYGCIQHNIRTYTYFCESVMYVRMCDRVLLQPMIYTYKCT